MVAAMATPSITERGTPTYEGASAQGHLEGGLVTILRGSDTYRILPFDLSQIDQDFRTLPHLWHGSVNGKVGVYSTYNGKTAWVMD